MWIISNNSVINLIFFFGNEIYQMVKHNTMPFVFYLRNYRPPFFLLDQSVIYYQPLDFPSNPNN